MVFIGKWLVIGYFLANLYIFFGFVDCQQQQRQSNLVVYTFPPASSSLFVACWSNSTQTDRLDEKIEFDYTGEISWTVYSNPSSPSYYDVYWCRARMGSNILIRFPVYGDGADRNNAEWIINSRGRRRISANGRFVDDQRGNWIVT